MTAKIRFHKEANEGQWFSLRREYSKDSLLSTPETLPPGVTHCMELGTYSWFACDVMAAMLVEL